MTARLPSYVRVSSGSASILELIKEKQDAEPTTSYLMTYWPGKCKSNCSFCPQARGSLGRKDMLSRISWPVFRTKRVLEKLDEAFAAGKTKRVCIQSIQYPGAIADLSVIVRAIHHRINIPISVSCQPLSSWNIRILARAGTERIGIPLDAATGRLLNKIKGKSVGGFCTWKGQFKLLKTALEIFGEGRISTHLIVGLGETEREMIETIQRCKNINVLPALFAFTPVRGTALERKRQPSVYNYRRIQISRYLIVNGLTRYERMRFDRRGQILDFGVDGRTILHVVESGKAFLTSGCPDCNRPCYNERPGGPTYNYPRNLMEQEINETRLQSGLN